MIAVHDAFLWDQVCVLLLCYLLRCNVEACRINGPSSRCLSLIDVSVAIRRLLPLVHLHYRLVQLMMVLL